MRHEWSVPDASEADCGRLAELVALKLAKGDTIALSGELGSGKTTFARQLVRALLGDGQAEVPSPTFSLVQTYDTPRLSVAHIDLYRLAGARETGELGLEDMSRDGALIVEWPERAASILTGNRLEVTFREGSNPETRAVAMTGLGTWAPRLARVADTASFLSHSKNWDRADIRYLQGDASARGYARLAAGDRNAVLMDFPRQPDGAPIRDGLPYSRIAHLAEDVTPFVAVQAALKAAGLSVPEIYAADLGRGLLLLEDFGDRVFGRELAAGASQAELWRAAVDALVVIGGLPAPAKLPLPDGSFHDMPAQDAGVLSVEIELILDWYWPAAHGSVCPEDARAEFLSMWQPIIARLTALEPAWVLRDYHSPNLMWLPEREGARRAGLLDFQDALRGPAAYDLVSLLQDARVDVAADLEAGLFAYYVQAMRGAGHTVDDPELRFAYAALGAQRNTKVAGIFARLAKRDGKPAYLQHLPRIWGYLARDLAHPELAGLRVWYERHFPANLRDRVLQIPMSPA